jgi:hypothetical protein
MLGPNIADTIWLSPAVKNLSAIGRSPESDG